MKLKSLLLETNIDLELLKESSKSLPLIDYKYKKILMDISIKKVTKLNSEITKSLSLFNPNEKVILLHIKQGDKKNLKRLDKHLLDSDIRKRFVNNIINYKSLNINSLEEVTLIVITDVKFTSYAIKDREFKIYGWDNVNTRATRAIAPGLKRMYKKIDNMGMSLEQLKKFGFHPKLTTQPEASAKWYKYFNGGVTWYYLNKKYHLFYIEPEIRYSNDDTKWEQIFKDFTFDFFSSEEETREAILLSLKDGHMMNTFVATHKRNSIEFGAFVLSKSVKNKKISKWLKEYMKNDLNFIEAFFEYYKISKNMYKKYTSF